MKTYRVWFNDGSALLVDAENLEQAKKVSYCLLPEDLQKELVVSRIVELK